MSVDSIIYISPASAQIEPEWVFGIRFDGVLVHVARFVAVPVLIGGSKWQHKTHSS